MLYSRRMVESLRNHFQRVQRSPFRQVLDLVPARCAGGGDDCLGLQAQSGQQLEIGDLSAEVEVAALVAERARHAATAAVEHGDVQPGDEAKGRGGPAGAAQRFLMAM